MRINSSNHVVKEEPVSSTQAEPTKNHPPTGSQSVFENREEATLSSNTADRSDVKQEGLSSSELPVNEVFFDPQKMNGTKSTDSNPASFQVASLSLRDKQSLYRHKRAIRKNLETLKIIGELPKIQNKLDRADALLKIAKNTNSISQRDYVNLSIKVNQFRRGYKTLDETSLKQLAKDFSEAGERGKAQKEARKEFSQKVDKAFTLFDEGGLITDAYQIIQLGDVKPLQNLSNNLKQSVADNVDSLYRAGGINTAVGLIADTTANTIIDIWMPTNVLDVVGTGKTIRETLKSIPKINHSLKELAEKKVEGLQYANGKLTIGSVNLIKSNIPFTKDQKKALTLIKIAELADARQTQNIEKIKSIFRELDSPIVKETLADIAVKKMMDFGSDNLLLSSASYKASSEIEKSTLDLFEELSQQVRQIF